MSLDNTVDAPSPYGWDWSATTHDTVGSGLTVRELAGRLVGVLDGAHAIPGGKGVHGWSDSIEVFDAEGYRLGSVFYCAGPNPSRTDVFVQATSEAADRVRSRVVEHQAKSARVDTKVDTLADFDLVDDIMQTAAEGYGSLITRIESHQRGESKGRTTMLGSPSSAIRIRLYEKWLEAGVNPKTGKPLYEPGTNRVEVQLRPPSQKKRDVSAWSREQTFCASRVATTIAALLGNEVAEPGSLHIDRGTPDLEKSLATAAKQYGKAYARFLEVSGGDVDRLVTHLTTGLVGPVVQRERVDAAERRARAMDEASRVERELPPF